MPVNPNEAPEGFMAVESEIAALCAGCHFASLSDEQCQQIMCMSWERDDGSNVIFIRAKSKAATANWPYDSEGTPV